VGALRLYFLSEKETQMETVTNGLSPKVYVPLIVGVVVGAVLLLAGEHGTGVTVLLATAGLCGIGTGAKPGDVVVNDVDALDMGKLEGVLAAPEPVA
jgi:hypothetical protein